MDWPFGQPRQFTTPVTLFNYTLKNIFPQNNFSRRSLTFGPRAPPFVNGRWAPAQRVRRRTLTKAHRDGYHNMDHTNVYFVTGFRSTSAFFLNQGVAFAVKVGCSLLKNNKFITGIIFSQCNLPHVVPCLELHFASSTVYLLLPNFVPINAISQKLTMLFSL